MKICVIGNSHVAALKLGWKRIRSDWTGVAMHFFAAPATEMNALSANSPSLEPTTENLRRYLMLTSGAGMIDLSAFDMVALHGMAFSNRFVRSVYHRYRLIEHADRRGFLISRDTFVEAVKGLLCSSMCWRIRELIIASSGRMPAIICQPNPGQRIVEADSRWRIPSEDRKSLAGIFEQALDGIRSDGTIVLVQPAETVIDQLFSKVAYAADTESFDRAFGSLAEAASASGAKMVETAHMNPEFGALILREFLSLVTARSP